MTAFARSPITAVLGPTNTGKTHLAVERLCGHSSGMMGFPLRLLAREVYDRVVRIKGAHQVALVTGEEKIVPPNARWFLCTAESMPLDRDFAFVALDEAQLGADMERGHVFTDRLLRARGREETMILGSEALAPMLRVLVKDAEIIGRPRFSTLSYAGIKKLSRLPKRSAIVAFSAEEVYAVAEMLRRLRGGAAVVMGALSPRTRNAQVAMFQAGEVDYLVATDAIGMGLNMDVAHVAFASLRKFDGRRQRRLTVSEMAQIAGRAGRHQRDGTFGSLGGEESPAAFNPDEIDAIEHHRFPRLDHLYWRDGTPDQSSIDAMIAALEAPPGSPVLRPAPEAIDLAVLKRLAGEEWVRERTRGAALVGRLWAACGVPDFRKTGVDHHSRFVARLYESLSQGNGHIAAQWFAEELARLDSVHGDVETVAGRIAAARSWAYIAQRPDWLADPLHWAERTRALEEKLSDALHERLTQRFVDSRTTALMRSVGVDASNVPVVVDEAGDVSVDGHSLGRLEGFRFHVAPDARQADKRLLLAAAERRLGAERTRRAVALAAAGDAELTLKADAGAAIELVWRGGAVAALLPGATLLRPTIRLDRGLDVLDKDQRDRIREQLMRWVSDQTEAALPPLVALDRLAHDPAELPAVRAVAAPLAAAGGVLARAELAVAALVEGEARQRLRAAGTHFGALDLFDARLLKPKAMRWRLALLAVQSSRPMPPTPPPGATVLPAGTPGATPQAGFRTIADQAVRVDLVERIARALHDGRRGRVPFAPDPTLATSIGLGPATFARLLTLLGFAPAAEVEGRAHWSWRGRPKPRSAPRTAPRGAFAALANLTSGNG